MQVAAVREQLGEGPFCAAAGGGVASPTPNLLVPSIGFACGVSFIVSLRMFRPCSRIMREVLTPFIGSL